MLIKLRPKLAPNLQTHSLCCLNRFSFCACTLWIAPKRYWLLEFQFAVLCSCWVTNECYCAAILNDCLNRAIPFTKDRRRSTWLACLIFKFVMFTLLAFARPNLSLIMREFVWLGICTRRKCHVHANFAFFLQTQAIIEQVKRRFL
jgi:hypothetical protein